MPVVIYRSSWELAFCRWCDFSPSVIKWSSEPCSNPSYKSWHKPNTLMKADGGKAKTLQGYYNIQNVNKYVEETRIEIPYYDRVSKLEECKKYGLNPNDPKNWLIRHYHVDFWVELKKDENTIEKWFVEIKPEHKLKKPMPPSVNSSLKEQRIFNNAAKEYLLNEAKFAAMNAFAQKHNAKFYIFTEKTLERLVGKFFVTDK